MTSNDIRTDETTDTVVLVGNPRPRSRTRAAAEAVAARIGGRVRTVDLADLAPEVLLADAPAVDEALRAVAGARFAVVATPVYKASYTGLLKGFLDRYGYRGLAGVTAVPLVVSASQDHARAGDDHLRPLLLELGATVPATSFALLETELADVDRLADAWVTTWLDPAATSEAALVAGGRPMTALDVAAGDALTADEFRSVFRGHPAGVAVVALRDGDRPVGFTATSVISVSADPPLLAFSLAASSSSWPAVSRAATVAVSFLASWQADVSARFATSGIDRFADGGWRSLGTGEPVIEGAVAWVRARVVQRTAVGSGRLVTLRAVDHDVDEGGTPLVFHDRGYHGLRTMSRPGTSTSSA